MTVPKDRDLTQPMVSPQAENPSIYLDPITRAISDGAHDIDLDEIERLKDVTIKDTDAATIVKADILEVKDLPSDSQIGHLVFRWLNPKHRSKVGMGRWMWVKGELANLVRSKKIISSVIGGESGTSVITNGDLMLAFMPRQIYKAIKDARARLHKRELDSIMDVNSIRQSLDDSQEVTRDVKIERTYAGRREVE